MKAPLQQIIARRYRDRNLPIALVLPDGGRVPLSEKTEVDVYARTWNGLKDLPSPEMGRPPRAGAAVVEYAAEQQGKHPAPLRRVERVLPALAGRAHGVLLRLLRERCGYAGSGAAAEARSHLPQADARAGRGISRHRVRLGRADSSGCAGLRRQGHRHYPVAEPARLRSGE